MHKIKVVGVLIFVLSIVLALVFNTISKQNRINSDYLSIINEQRSYTQEISKSVLYLSKNKGSGTEQLDANIEKFLQNMKHQKIDSDEHDELLVLWESFYTDVEQFREKQKVMTAYSSILLDTLVNDIYIKNQKLIVAFDTYIKSRQKQYTGTMQRYKNVEYSL
jgi:inner membrane protein involved in colicin E2 resistance